MPDAPYPGSGSGSVGWGTPRGGIFVIGEVEAGTLTRPTLEALGAARGLATAYPGEPVERPMVTLLLATDAPGTAALGAGAHGADTTLICEDAAFAGAPAEALVAIAAQVAGQTAPRVVLGARSPRGREVMPRLAFRLGTALAQDCTQLDVDAEGRLLATRPIYGGAVLATVACMKSPAVASLRPGAFATLAADASRAGTVIPIACPAEARELRTRVIERVQQEQAGIRLEDARVVVAGGRGLGGPEPFARLEELARLLKGAVGASRAACDAGWVPSALQIGLTGKTVSPDLYIAIGISGASQHLAGCGGARCIVAINKDPAAGIFRQARFGVAGDWQEVLPAFLDQLHELIR